MVTPIPTPYDITDIPHFSRPLSLAEIAFIVISILLALTLAYWIRRWRKNRAEVLLPDISKDLHALNKQEEIKKSQLALFAAKVRRASEMGYLSTNEAATNNLKELERCIYGPIYNSKAAHDILNRLTRSLGGGLP